MEIDINDVITMGDFRGAIENAVDNYVKEYVSNALSGVHGTMEVAQEATSGLKEEENIFVKLDLSEKQIGKHWGIVNITKNNSYMGSFPQVQIIIWWDENNNFNYSIAHNSLGGVCKDSWATPTTEQYVEDNSIEFDDRNDILSFTIKSISIRGGTAGGKFKVDYHIW